MVEGGVEAGDLRQVGAQGQHGAHGGEVVRLVQRGQRGERVQLRDDFGGEADGGDEFAAAVDDAVAGGDEAVVTQVGVHPVEHGAEQVFVREGLAMRPAALEGEGAAGLDKQVGLGTDVFHFADGDAEQDGADFEEGEFDAGGTGVQRQDRVRHLARPRPSSPPGRRRPCGHGRRQRGW